MRCPERPPRTVNYARTKILRDASHLRRRTRRKDAMERRTDGNLKSKSWVPSPLRPTRAVCSGLPLHLPTAAAPQSAEMDPLSAGLPAAIDPLGSPSPKAHRSCLVLGHPSLQHQPHSPCYLSPSPPATSLPLPIGTEGPRALPISWSPSKPCT